MRPLRSWVLAGLCGLLSLVACLALLETAAWYVLVRKQLNFYLPLELTPAHVAAVREQFAATFDPVLGWEPRGEDPRGFAGPARDPAGAAVALFGDSFTLGHPEHEKSWAVQLERQLGRPVLNFGVAGYGPDQAYLRFEKRYVAAERTPYVVLGVLSENIARIVNRYRGFYYRKTYLNGVKPRFVLDAGGALQLLPTPIGSAAELDRLLDPAFREEIGRSDYWYRHYAAHGLNRTVHFPYAYYLLRALPFYVRTYRDKRLSNAADYKHLYDDPAATALLEAIVVQFARRAAEEGAVPLVVFFPGWKDFVDRAQGRPVAYAGFCSRVRARGCTVWDALDYFAPGTEVGAYFRSYGDGHYNETGESVIAAGVLADLQRIESSQHRLARP